MLPSWAFRLLSLQVSIPRTRHSKAVKTKRTVCEAPAVDRDVHPPRNLQPPSEQGLRWKSRAQRRNPLAIIQEVQETNVIVVNENLDQLAAQQRIIEQEFAALVQAQVALVTQLEDIKNNIRVNHFKSRFSQVVRYTLITGRETLKCQH